MKFPVVAFAVLLAAVLLTKGVLWDRDRPHYSSLHGLRVRPSSERRVHADGSEVIGVLAMPRYLHWLTKKESLHDVRVNLRTKKWEWYDGGPWREMPANTIYALD